MKAQKKPGRAATRAYMLSFLGLMVAASSCTLLVGTFEGPGGTGGGGPGGPTCKVPDDCPKPKNSCITNTCADGACGVQFQPAGFGKMPTTDHDCHATECDGNGNISKVVDVTNLPIPANPCKVGTCDSMGGMGSDNVSAGTACTGGKCDGMGACVECLTSADCMNGDSCSSQNKCVPPSCSNGVQDQGETDKDCGGSSPCNRCVAGQKCTMGSDCLDKICSQNTCAAATCTDTVQNGNETDMDCGGGACPKCGPDKTCMLGSDCAGGDCGTNGKCTANCLDNVQNNAETDTDCGGGTCSPCAAGKKCMVDADCASNACDANTNTCVADQCADHHQNGAETDNDCGGGTCPDCGVGKKCKVNGDCTSNACNTLSKTCVASPCNDNQLDGTETDVDCGGGCSAKCANGKKCMANADCASNACDVVSTTCVASQCNDNHQDGSETASDCGGGTCPGCTVGQNCANNNDCVSMACNMSTHVCASGPCSDTVKDGAETDIDCGGGTCAGCPNNKKCVVNTDCLSNACNGVTLLCVADQCTDQKKDGAETDTDCGGGACPKCPNGKVCATNTDCTSSACDAQTLTCVASPCADHHQDGAETDIDCGGGTCSACANGKKCLVNNDCTSQACDAQTLTCDTTQCVDKKKDGSETDMDCGGGTCPACANGKICVLDSDCTSTACDGLSLTCATSKCSDHKKDGVETDTDCGGGTCPTCPTGKKCQINSDCSLNACDSVSLTCVADQCTDHHKDGLETDTDCGGGVCGKCGLGLKCAGDGDCISNACDAISLTCISNQCADHRIDGAESDVDCGGGTCNACLSGQHCNNTGDCQAGHVCLSGTKVCS